MFLKVLKWIGMLGAAFLVGAYLTAWAAPVTYLKMVSHIQIAPISISWAPERANFHSAAETYDFCEHPVLFAWYGSFGGGPVLPNGLNVPDAIEFEEVVLFRSGVIYESAKKALAEMAVFNEAVLSECLIETES
ncbi:MAG: hypothetical protein AAF674_21975 [Pseudomonadota bacterium]